MIKIVLFGMLFLACLALLFVYALSEALDVDERAIDSMDDGFKMRCVPSNIILPSETIRDKIRHSFHLI